MNTHDFKRRLTAILSADVVGYSRLMREDEDGTIRSIKLFRGAITKLIQDFRGRVVDAPGDNILAEFTSVVDAVNCAVEIQRDLAERNDELPENRRMEFRIGINMGDVIEEGDRLYGDGINIAARMESLAPAGGICISGTVYDAVEKKLGLEYEYLGEKDVKNIETPVRVYRVLSYPGAAAHRVITAKKTVGVAWRNAVVFIAAILILGAAAVSIRNYYLRPAVLPVEVASVEKMAFALPDKPSIAVLPFVNMSGDPGQEYFSDGITEEIITALAKTPKLFVIARNSTFTYKGKPVKVQQVSEDLGVRYVLEGSVRKSGDRVRITAQLIDALKGHHLWAERYDRNLKDIFAIQDEMTKKIITALEIKLTVGEQARIWAKGTNKLDAYLKLLAARENVLQMNKKSNALARQLAKEAIDLDPHYAIAYTTLGATHMFDVWLGTSSSPKQSMAQAIELAQKSISMDETVGKAHGLLGLLYTMTGQYEKGILEAERGVTLEPNSDMAYNYLGLTLRFGGRPEEAVSAIKEAIRLNPFAPSAYLFNMGLSYLNLGQNDEAIKWCKKATIHEPNNLFAYLALTAAYSLSGRDEEARMTAEEVLRIAPKFSVQYYSKALIYKNQSDKDRFISALCKAGLPETPPLPLPDKPSIAVLPFVNMSGDPEQEYFSDGISEEIITGLSKVPRLFVIARNSTFTYKGKPVKVQQVAEELGVQYVLEGSVRKAKDRVRITAQLVDATTGKHLWAEKYDRDLKDIFALQDEIMMKVIAALQVKLTEGEQALITAGGTDSFEAYAKFLQGVEYNKRFNREGFLLARKMAEEAIALDPNYPRGYKLLATTHWQEARLGFSTSPRESLAKAAQLYQKVIDMDPSDATAHAFLGMVYSYMRQHDKGIAEVKKGVALNPNAADAQVCYGTILLFNGRPKEAVEVIKKAIRLNPFPPNWYFQQLGFACYYAQRHTEAIAALKKALAMKPDNLFAHVHLTVAYSLSGREQEARAEAAEVLRINPRFSLQGFADTSPFKNKSDTDLSINALREAGLPE